MTMPEYFHWTEEQRAKAYRMESIQQLMRQTKALETIKNVLVGWTVLILLGAFLTLIAVGVLSS